MAAVGVSLSVQAGAVERCQGLYVRLPSTSRSSVGACFGTPVYAGLTKHHVQCLNSLSSAASLRSASAACLEVFKVSTRGLWRVEHVTSVRSQSGLEEAPGPIEQDRRSLEVSYFSETRPADVALNNPLVRQHRLGCGWFAVVMEWEGVIVEDDTDLERKAWTALAEEESKRPPPAYVLRRAEGMKNEQAISEVFCWTRDYRQLKRLATRKEELYEQMQGGVYRLRPGSKEFIQTLKMHKIPVAVASTRPRLYLERAIEAVGMEGVFNVVLAAEDVHRGKPDPEMYLYAGERLGFAEAPERCMVLGNANSSVEAAHDGRMKAVAVAGKHPVYELSAADMVVRRLDELSVIDLKNLSDLESPEFAVPELELELEFEEEQTLPQVAINDL